MDNTNLLITILIVIISVAMIVALVIVITVFVKLRRLIIAINYTAKNSNQTMKLLKQSLSKKLTLLTVLKIVSKYSKKLL